MTSKNLIWKDAIPILIGQLIGVAAVSGIFALLCYFDWTVPTGSFAGALLATANYLLMYYFANKAADKAEKQDVVGGQKIIQLSYMGRMIGLLVALVILAKSGFCNVIALAIPLAFNRPILTIHEWIRQKGGASA